MRAEWDIARYLKSGRLQGVAAMGKSDADIYAVYREQVTVVDAGTHLRRLHR